MSELRGTGNQILDEVAVLQMDAGKYPAGRDKIDYIFDAVRSSRAGSLLGRTYFINSLMAFGKVHDAKPRTHILFPDGLVFTGLAAAYRYMLDEETPMDCITVCFEDVSIGEARIAGDIVPLAQIQVPVLAIQSCIDLMPSPGNLS